jgi:hypothetical protein
LQVTPAEASRVLAGVLAPFEEIDEADLVEEEADTLEEYDDARASGEVKGALAMVRAFAIAVPVSRGLHRVLAGDASGWVEIERAWLLESLTIHLIGPRMADAAPELLAYALVLGEDEPAGWLAELVRASAQAQGECTPYAAFVERLHARVAAADGSGSGAIGDLEAYGEVLRAWDDPAGLSAALAHACDLHLRLVADAEDDDEAPAVLRFAPPIPLEIAAALAVRRRRGEPIPVVAHPLVHTPLATIPERRTYAPEPDPWFRRALDVAIAGGLLPADFRWPG